MTSTRPSGSSAMPEQNTLSGAVWVANVWDGRVIDLGGLGLLPAVELQDLPVVHQDRVDGHHRPASAAAPTSPALDAVGVTLLDAADAGPVPTLLVAVTVKV